MSSATQQTNSRPLVACTISRDVTNFDLLIEDMETAVGEAWGDLGFPKSLAFLGQLEARSLEFVAIAIDEDDEDHLGVIGEIITLAGSLEIKVILIADDVSPSALHALLRQGADEFVPYPLPEGELSAAIERLRKPGSPRPRPRPRCDCFRAHGDRRGRCYLGHSRPCGRHRCDHASGQSCLGAGQFVQGKCPSGMHHRHGSSVWLGFDVS